MTADDSDMSLAATRSGTHLVGHGTVTQENNLQGWDEIEKSIWNQESAAWVYQKEWPNNKIAMEAALLQIETLSVVLWKIFSSR